MSKVHVVSHYRVDTSKVLILLRVLQGHVCVIILLFGASDVESYVIVYFVFVCSPMFPGGNIFVGGIVSQTSGHRPAFIPLRRITVYSVVSTVCSITCRFVNRFIRVTYLS
jgi:hypothetical protein